MTFVRSKTGIAVILLIATFAFLYFFTGAFGGTKIGLTLKTNPSLEDGLVAHYTFDGDLNTSIENYGSSGVKGYLADVSNATSSMVRPGVIGQALYFDGVEDYVRLDDPLYSTTTGFSVGFWIKGPSAGTDYDAVCSGVTPDVIYEDTGPGGGSFPHFQIMPVGQSVGFCIRTNSGSTPLSVRGSIPVMDNEWHHVTWTDFDGDVAVFIDGERDFTDFSYTPDMMSNLAQSGIGANEDGVGIDEEFTGHLDDLRLYNRALSTSTVKRLYDLGNKTKFNKTTDTNADLKNGLVAHYTFDGESLDWSSTTAEIRDISGNENNGDAVNLTSVNAIAGKIGQGLESDGLTGVVNIDPFNGITGSPLTIAVWVKPSTNSCDTGLDCMIVAGNSVSNVQLGTNDGVEMRFCRNYTQCVTADISNYVVGEWQHLTLVADGTNCIMYKNGTSLNSASCSGTGMSPVRIGDHFGGTRNFGGLIDDVRIYNRGLSASEVSRLYKLGENVKINKTLKTNSELQDGLVGHWSFDGPDIDLGTPAAEVIDRGSGGNDGDWKDHATSTVPGKIGQAIRFDGVDDIISIPEFPESEGMTAFTVAGWMRPLVNNETLHIISKDRSGFAQWNLGRSSGGDANKVFFQIGTSTGSVSENSPDAFGTDFSWHHIAGVYDDPNIYIYVDGVQVESTNTGGGAIRSDYNHGVCIGGESSGSPCTNVSNKVELDDVRYYNRALSTDEIKRLYQLGQ